MKKKSSRVVCLALALLMLALSACGDQGDQTRESESSDISDETFYVVLDDEPTALYAQFGNMVQSMITISNCLYEHLVYWDTEANELKPGLATYWEPIDSTHWRIHLREGVIAEDGTPFTAEDVLYSFQVGCDGSDVSSWARVFDMDEFVVEDEYTIIVATLDSSPKLMDTLTKSCYAMLSKSSVEASGGIEAQQTAPHGGTGKYVFDEWVSGQYIRLVRNENYWDTDSMAYFAEIEFTFVGDAATRLMALQSGNAGYTHNLQSTQILGLEGDDSIRGYATETPGAEVIMFNCGKEPFNDERVRQAVYYLIDPAECALLATDGLSSVSNSMLGTTNAYYHEPDGYTREVDVDKAKTLLAEAGYPEGLTIDLEYTGSSVVYEIIKAQLEQGGVILNLIPVEYAALMVSRRTGEYEMMITSLKTVDIIQTYQMLDARVGYALNVGGCQCSDEELYAILDAIYAEFDESEALQDYYDLQDYVRDHCVMIGLYNTMTYSAIAQEYSDPAFDLAGSVDISSIHRIS